MSRRRCAQRTSLFLALSSLAGLFFMGQLAHADSSKYPQFAQLAPPANVSLISVDELANEIREGKKPVIIDVRTEAEYREVHILSALSVPLGEFSAHLQNIPRDRLVILY
jgi:rhodanese-related sulfurtransferase